MSLTLSLWPAFLNRMCSARMVGWETTRNPGYLKIGTSIPVSSLWRYNEAILKLIIGFPFLGISAFVYVFPPHAECHCWDSLLRHRIRHGWWNVVASHVSLYINHHLAAQCISLVCTEEKVLKPAKTAMWSGRSFHFQPARCWQLQIYHQKETVSPKSLTWNFFYSFFWWEAGHLKDPLKLAMCLGQQYVHWFNISNFMLAIRSEADKSLHIFMSSSMRYNTKDIMFHSISCVNISANHEIRMILVTYPYQWFPIQGPRDSA